MFFLQYKIFLNVGHLLSSIRYITYTYIWTKLRLDVGVRTQQVLSLSAAAKRRRLCWLILWRSLSPTFPPPSSTWESPPEQRGRYLRWPTTPHLSYQFCNYKRLEMLISMLWATSILILLPFCSLDNMIRMHKKFHCYQYFHIVIDREWK